MKSKWNKTISVSEAKSAESSIQDIVIRVYKFLTDLPESDGTLEWNSTTLVLVKLTASGKTGIGFTYSHESAAQVIKSSFSSILTNADPFNVPLLWNQMLSSVRNYGSRGIAASAISAVDIALWDLKAKLLDLPLCKLFGMAREKMPIYGSGGFTSYSQEQLRNQFEGWKGKGVNAFKMKVGRKPQDDIERVKQARNIIGNDAALFVDANGAYTRKQALDLAISFKESNVTWFEEPVSSDDLEGLNLIRDQAPAGINIAAGEYGYDNFYFRKMLEAQAVDVLQVDATRALGFTGFLQACHLSHAFEIPLSSHTAPSLHLHPCLSDPNVLHMEFFHDHARIEEAYFEGFPKLADGCLIPHLDRPGHGLEVKEKNIQEFLINQC